MAKSLQPVLFLATTCIAHSDSLFYVQDKVYCNTCHAQFKSKVSEYLPGAKRHLECRDREGGHLTYTIEGECDATGTYRLPVEGEHEEEICEVFVMKSNKPDSDDEAHSWKRPCLSSHH